jgi:hypothetical protein
MQRPSIAAPGTEGLVLEAHVPGRYVAATSQSIIAFYWLGDAEPEGVQRLDQLCEKQTAGRTRPFSAVHVVHAGAGLPTAEVRNGLIAIMRRYADVTCCLGVVLLGAGFWASAMQSALTGVRMVVPSGGAQMRFGTTSNEIIPWLASAHAKRTGERLGEAQLLSMVQQLRKLGDAPP